MLVRYGSRHNTWTEVHQIPEGREVSTADIVDNLLRVAAARNISIIGIIASNHELSELKYRLPVEALTHECCGKGDGLSVHGVSIVAGTTASEAACGGNGHTNGYRARLNDLALSNPIVRSALLELRLGRLESYEQALESMVVTMAAENKYLTHYASCLAERIKREDVPGMPG